MALIDDVIAAVQGATDEQKAALAAAINPTVAAQELCNALEAQRRTLAQSSADALGCLTTEIANRKLAIQAGDLTIKPLTDDDVTALAKPISVKPVPVSVTPIKVS